MKSLGAKFSDSQLNNMKETAAALDVSISSLARAALSLGITQVDTLIGKDREKARKLVLISDALAK